ncbi:unnamed protein product [Hyaloperonospora brassicae]|uniref:Uncharacterized protein n=1 Tax=Hyaloperonospora brassicae TaxID=162125 RepID=A0AAV0TT84_HYABA|nr:unnamed protein product [Hyaloperonospora brassicae]
MVHRRSTRTATKAPPPPRSSSKMKQNAIASSSSVRLFMCSVILPNLLMVAVALVAVWFEVTTSDFYVQSAELLSLLKRSFIFWVCLAVRMQLKDFVTPPEHTRRAPSLWKEGRRHTRALFAAVAANLLGTTIIRPVFGAAPQFEDTVRLVVPIYFLVEVVVDGLRFPLPLLTTVVGLSVSWLKAVTIPKLVMEWQSTTSAHPIAFLAISTANLYASGLVLRYLANYARTRRVLDVSMETVTFLVKSVGTSAAVAVVAYVANHLMANKERVLEARALYFIVAWFVLDKYWKKAVRELLIYLCLSKEKSKGE